jgi:hypothetical protein
MRQKFTGNSFIQHQTLQATGLLPGQGYVAPTRRITWFAALPVCI